MLLYTAFLRAAYSQILRLALTLVDALESQNLEIYYPFGGYLIKYDFKHFLTKLYPTIKDCLLIKYNIAKED
jgi:hypothetical protein